MGTATTTVVPVISAVPFNYRKTILLFMDGMFRRESIIYVYIAHVCVTQFGTCISGAGGLYISCYRGVIMHHPLVIHISQIDFNTNSPRCINYYFPTRGRCFHAFCLTPKCIVTSFSCYMTILSHEMVLNLLLVSEKVNTHKF